MNVGGMRDSFRLAVDGHGGQSVRAGLHYALLQAECHHVGRRRELSAHGGLSARGLGVRAEAVACLHLQVNVNLNCNIKTPSNLWCILVKT